MAVPEVPLFTVMATEVPEIDHDSTTFSISNMNANAARCCSLRRQERRERRAFRQGSHRIQQQQTDQQGPQIKALVYSQVGMSDSRNTIVAGRHSGKQNRKLLIAELEKLKKENDAFKIEEKDLHTKLSELENEKDLLLRDMENVIAIKNEKKELEQDVFMLKNLVIRLNVELERAQDKLHSIKSSVEDKNITSGIGDESPFMESSKGSGKVHPVWGRSEMNVVAPLLQAYQETLEDRDQLIMSYRREMENFTSRCKTIVAENESLHQQLIESNKRGEVTYTEWQSVQMEAAMTRDQNELLLRKAKLNQNKINDIHSAYLSKLSDLSVDKDEIQERLSKAQAESYVLKGRCNTLQEECDRIKSDSTQKIDVSVHKAAIDECKRLFEELKQRYESERDNLIRKVTSLEAARPDVDIKLVNVTAERDHAISELKASERLNRRHEEKIIELEGRLQQSERSCESCKRQLNQAMVFARELIAEQELLVSQLDERRTVVKIESEIATRVGNLRQKLKGVERDACKELDGMEQKFKQQASSLDRMKEHFSQEINRMKQLIEEKNVLIHKLKLEKSKVEDQLEVVWKAAMKNETESKETK